MMVYRLNWSPAVLDESAAPELYSEGRALRHVVALARDLPDRQVGSRRPGQHP